MRSITAILIILPIGIRIHPNQPIIIINSDLKLENVLLTEDLNVKLIDFGFTRAYNPNRLLDSYCGSIAYAAPEMIPGKKYQGPDADIWSLGIIMYTIYCGYLPFDDENEPNMHRKIMELDYDLPDFLTLGIFDVELKMNRNQRPYFKNDCH